MLYEHYNRLLSPPLRRKGGGDNGAITLPSRRNDTPLAAQSPRHKTAIASPLRCNGDAIAKTGIQRMGARHPCHLTTTFLPSTTYMPDGRRRTPSAGITPTFLPCRSWTVTMRDGSATVAADTPVDASST